MASYLKFKICFTESVEGRAIQRVSEPVLVSARIELIFLLRRCNNAVFWIQDGNGYEKNADRMLIFVVVARKSRASQLPVSW